MAGRTGTQGNEGALIGTPEGDTVARTQSAGKARFSVYEQISQADVYGAGAVPAAIGEALNRTAGEETEDWAGPAPDAEGATVLVLLATDVEARRGVDACWSVAEGQHRDRAEGENPPVLLARNQKDGGTTSPAPYALEKVVQRKRAS